MRPMAQTRRMRLNVPAVILIIVGVICLGIGIYWFAAPPIHPRRGGLFVVLAIGCAAGAWLVSRRAHAKA